MFPIGENQTRFWKFHFVVFDFLDDFSDFSQGFTLLYIFFRFFVVMLDFREGGC